MCIWRGLLVSYGMDPALLTDAALGSIGDRVEVGDLRSACGLLFGVDGGFGGNPWDFRMREEDIVRAFGESDP